MVFDLTILLISKTSYEEERSQIDFDDVVRQNQQKYKEETKLSNQQVGRRSFKSFLGKKNF